MKTPHQPVLEEIRTAYIEMRDLGKALGIEAWDQQLIAHKEQGSLHPQELRHLNVPSWKKAQTKFYGLMEQLVSYQAELKAGMVEVLALVQEIFPDKVVRWTEESVPDHGPIIDIFGVPYDQQRKSGVYGLRDKIKSLIGGGCLFMFRPEKQLKETAK